MKQLIVAATLVTTSAAAQEDNALCLAAAHRFQDHYEREAEGTRHEAQIAAAYERYGSKGAAIREVAKTFSDDECALILAAPDSTVRAMAIAGLPERNE